MIGKLKTILTLLSFCSLLSTSFASTAQLAEADSMFMDKKYTEALEIYEAQFISGEVSPAMVLKMAFIQEGLKNYVSALYYLNTYYKLTADKAVLVKMQELAAENDLVGYEVGDRDFFTTNMLRFKNEIQLVLLVLAVILLVVAYQSKKKDQLSIGVPIIQLMVLTALMIVSNDWLHARQAIVKEKTLLMSGPSAAAEPIEYIRDGHKLAIKDESDVWAKVEWEGREAYIRKGKLLMLRGQENR